MMNDNTGRQQTLKVAILERKIPTLIIPLTQCTVGIWPWIKRISLKLCPLLSRSNNVPCHCGHTLLTDFFY